MREKFQRDLANRTQNIENIIAESGDAHAPAIALLLFAVQSLSNDDYLSALDIARRGIQEAESTPSIFTRQIKCALWDIKATSWARLFQSEQARRCGERLVELIEPSSPTLTHAMLQLGHYCIDAGAYEAALHYYSIAETHLSARGNPYTQAELSIGKADYLAQTGHVELAVENSRQALSLLSALNERPLKEIAPPRHRHLLLIAREQHAFYQAWDGYSDSAIEAFRQLEKDILEALPTAPKLQRNLARSLDHHAETLERAQRLPEALNVARRSVTARRELATHHLHERIPMLHSLVTAIRLAEANGQHSEAIAMSEEALAWIKYLPTCIRIADDLKGQLLLSNGLALIADGQGKQGEQMLHDAGKTFGKLVRQSPNNAMYRDAMAKINLELGLSLSPKTPKQARKQLAQASSMRAWLARHLPCPLHQAGWADALTELAHVELKLGQYSSAHQRYLEAVKLYTDIEVLPVAFTDVALSLSRGLLSSDADDHHAIQETCNCFAPLARTLVDATDFIDPQLASLNPQRLSEFIRLWLEWFIDKDLPEQIIQLLSFAHGRRLASLAYEEQLAKTDYPGRSTEESRLHQLRQAIRQLDLEIAEILPTCSNTFLKEGSQLARREELRRTYLNCRDTLARQGKRARKTPLLSAKHLTSRSSSPLIVLCLPRAFKSTYAPCAVILDRDAAPKLVTLPEIDTAYSAFSGLIKNLSMGRSIRHGEFMKARSIPCSIDFDPYEQVLWAEMRSLWQRLLENMSAAQRQLTLITHSIGHNLPWLGSAPNGIKLNQLPSLHLYAERSSPARKNPPQRPSPEQPLVLLIPDTYPDPHHRLYHAPLEAAAIQATWPGSVITLQQAKDLEHTQPAIVWLIGHGMLERGHPRLGVERNTMGLPAKQLFAGRKGATGLFMASTCYLGRTLDLQGEPMGLHPLLWLNTIKGCTAGAIAPLDDLGAALMAILFHSIWRNTTQQTARSAFDQARSALLSGQWPPAALQLLDQLRKTTLPEIIEQARQDECITKAKVASIYPDTTPEEVQRHQHELRGKGRDCLLLWQDEKAHLTTALVERLSSNAGVRFSTRIWTWIG